MVVDLSEIDIEDLKAHLLSRGYAVRAKPKPDPAVIEERQRRERARFAKMEKKRGELKRLIDAAETENPEAVDFDYAVLTWRKKCRFFGLILDEGLNQSKAAERVGASAAAASKWVTDMEKPERKAKKRGPKKKKREIYNPAEHIAA